MTLKRGIAPKPASDRRRSAAGLQEQLDHRTRELNEALEQQAATSEVLHVISSAPGKLEHRFQGHTDESNAHLPGQIWQLVAPRGRQRSHCRDAWRALRVPRISESRTGRRSSPRKRYGTGRLKSGSGSNRRHKEGPNSRHEERLATIKLAKARSLMGVPMLKENEVIGGIAIYRQEVRPFSDKQIELLKNFADQAVIAIENVRLFEAEHSARGNLPSCWSSRQRRRTCCSVISSSPGDLQPVFEAMLENAVRICDATFGGIYRIEGDIIPRFDTLGCTRRLRGSA